MRLPTILALFVALEAVRAAPLSARWSDLTPRHAWPITPRGWTYHSPAPPNHIINLHISLAQPNLPELISALYAVSDPTHKSYGAHLSKAETDALAAPHPAAPTLVDEWLAHHGAAPATHSGASSRLQANVTIAQAERMLGATYAVYQHDVTGEYTVRTLSYAVPAVLHEHIALVAPTTYFGSLRSMESTSFIHHGAPTVPEDIEADFIVPGQQATVPISCEATITPACLRALYNSSTYVPQATTKNSIGVAGYLGEFANDADLQTFLKKYRKDAVGATFKHVQINGGGNDQTNPGTEANLDIQYVEGISLPTPVTYYSTGGSPPFKPDSATPTNSNEPYLDWLNYILAEKSLPQTFTTSYGDDEQTVPLDYARTVCNLFAQLGARGSSVLFSSGDNGVGADSCETNDGKNKVQFQPSFPATCPFVTTVGATTEISPEVGKSFSGGGFSNYFGQPSYQTKDVNAFVKALPKNFKGSFNKTGRAYPDVSAQGVSFQVVVGGSVQSVDGTSASTPTFAGIVSLLNDFRLAKGKKALGFLNPMLYSVGVAGLNDITSGSNPGCGDPGFTAKAGWDPVTGLGTPNFGKLQTIVAKI